LLEKSSLEISDTESKIKETEKLHDKIKKQKAELERKDTTIELMKNKNKNQEEENRTFEQDIKEKQTILTRDLNELNRKSESYLKKLRKSEISTASLKSIVLTVYKHLKDKCNENDKSLDIANKFNHSEAMKLLELSENELDMFINSPQDNIGECALVRLLDMDDIESDEISKLIIDSINKLVTQELK